MGADMQHAVAPNEGALIYVVEDDAAIRDELVAMLERNGYRTAHPARFDRVVEDVAALSPDLLLLDLTLPGTDGQLVCREVRAVSDVPIVILTSRVTETDEVLGMTMGADDFVAKPYSSRVLLARIAALLRRAAPQSVQASMLTHHGLTVDPARSEASCNGRTVELTKNELRIITLLMRRAGTIVSREAIMRDLWDSEAFVDDNTLTVNVNRLRQTLEKIGVSGYLVTHRGQGYSV